MKEIVNVSLIGLGAIGCAYASRIMEAMPESLTVISDPKRRNRYSEGLYVNGRKYYFPCVGPEVVGKPADLVIVTVKFHHLADAIGMIKNHVGPETVILSLLNGISSEEIIGNVYGMDKLLYGMCVGIDAVREEAGVYYSNGGKIYFGERENYSLSPRVEAVRLFLDQCRIPYVVPEDMIRTLWWKFMVNVGINQLSGVLQAPYGVFQRVPEAAELMKAAMREVIAIANAEGISLHEHDIEEFIHFLHTLSPEGKTSMLQDVEARRKTEVEMFAGDVCRLGAKYEVPTPVNDMLLLMIRALEKMFTDYSSLQR